MLIYNHKIISALKINNFEVVKSLFYFTVVRFKTIAFRIVRINGPVHLKLYGYPSASFTSTTSYILLPSFSIG